MNKIFIVGRLVSDPQPFVTQSGRLVSNITIACNDNTNKNETYFFPCVAWQTPAKFINTYLKKGDSVVIDGKLIRRSYVSKDGRNAYATEIIIDLIKLVSSSRKRQDSTYVENNQYNSFSNQKQNTEVFFENNSINSQNDPFYNQNQNIELKKEDNIEEKFVYSDAVFPKTNNQFENNFSNNNVSNDFNANTNFEMNNKNSVSSQNNDSSVIYNNEIINDEQYDEVIDLDWLDEIDN